MRLGVKFTYAAGKFYRDAAGVIWFGPVQQLSLFARLTAEAIEIQMEVWMCRDDLLSSDYSILESPLMRTSFGGHYGWRVFAPSQVAPEMLSPVSVELALRPRHITQTEVNMLFECCWHTRLHALVGWPASGVVSALIARYGTVPAAEQALNKL